MQTRLRTRLALCLVVASVVTLTAPMGSAGPVEVDYELARGNPKAPGQAKKPAPAPDPAPDPAPAPAPGPVPGTAPTTPSLFGDQLAFGVATPSNGASATEIAGVTDLVGEAPTVELWYRGFTQEVPRAEVEAIVARGALPLLTWEPWDWRAGVDQPSYRLSRIAEGAFDAYIRRTARTLREVDGPVLLRFAHEMNGDWYPWSEGANGNRPGDYVRAWNRVQDLFHAEGATNVRWVWSPNVEYPGSLPLTGLFPGTDRVDVVAVDGYNFGTSQSWSSWIAPAALFDPTFAAVRRLAPGTPIILGEVAASEHGGDKAAWVRDLFAWADQQPDLAGLVWFDLDKETDWRIGSSPASAAAFRESLAGRRATG